MPTSKLATKWPAWRDGNSGNRVAPMILRPKPFHPIPLNRKIVGVAQPQEDPIARP